jgi:hypothetical protein
VLDLSDGHGRNAAGGHGVEGRGEDAVVALRAGPHASAVVTARGRLWLWGRLVDAAALAHYHPHHHHKHNHHHRHHDSSGSAHPGGSPWSDWEGADGWRGGGDAVAGRGPVDWSWPGFGGPAPALVPWLEGRVKDVALGGWHALAVLE